MKITFSFYSLLSLSSIQGPSLSFPPGLPFPPGQKLGTLHLVINWTFYVTKHILKNLKNQRVLNILHIYYYHSKYIFWLGRRKHCCLAWLHCMKHLGPGNKNFQPNDSLFNLFMEDWVCLTLTLSPFKLLF